MTHIGLEFVSVLATGNEGQKETSPLKSDEFLELCAKSLIQDSNAVISEQLEDSNRVKNHSCTGQTGPEKCSNDQIKTKKKLPRLTL